MVKFQVLSAAIFLLFGISSGAQVADGPPPASELLIHLSPIGNDMDIGTPLYPILTLARAQVLVSEALRPPHAYTRASIVIAPGTYRNQSVLWTFVSNNPIVIQGSDSLNKPIFDGLGLTTPTSFFFHRHSTGGPTGLTIRNIAVRNYLNAITIRGNNINPSNPSLNRASRGTVIENNVFDKIGNAWVFTGEEAYSALNMQNTEDNVIRGNVFSRINAQNPHGTGLHAIYASHFARRNIIDNNVFSNSISGEVIKFRNQSDFNSVTNNSFINNRNWPAVYNWYAHSDSTNSECPNRDLYVSGNRVVLGSNSPAPPGHSNPSVFEFNSSRALYHAWTFSSTVHYFCPASQVPALLARTPVTYGPNHTQGCYVSLDRCPAMLQPRPNRNARYEFLDSDSNANMTSSVCVGRANTYYSSCSSQTPGTPQMAKTRFLNERSQVAEKIVAHGCVISATICPNLDFLPNQSRLDSQETHNSRSACLARISAYESSCKKDLSAEQITNLRIKVQYYLNGALDAEVVRYENSLSI